MEILHGADDFPAKLAAQYGYVNRVLPDTELDAFVDAFTCGIAGFEQLIDEASLPEDAEFAPGLTAFFQTSGRPENAGRVRSLFERGLQQPDPASNSTSATRSPSTRATPAGAES